MLGTVEGQSKSIVEGLPDTGPQAGGSTWSLQLGLAWNVTGQMQAGIQFSRVSNVMQFQMSCEFSKARVFQQNQSKCVGTMVKFAVWTPEERAMGQSRSRL